jgi:hypothetical protein
MSIIIKAKEYENPSEGHHHVRIKEVKDLGPVQTEHGTKEKLLIVMETGQPDSQGNPIKLYRRFNRTIHAKSAFRKFVRSVTGEDPGNEFDVETLLGREFDVVVELNERDGRVFPDITAILRPKPAGQSQAA